MSVDINDLWWDGTKTATNINCDTIMYGIRFSVTTTAPTISNMSMVNRQVYSQPNNLNVLTTIAQDSTATWPSADATLGNTGPIAWSSLKGYDSTWPQAAQSQSVTIDHTDKRWLFGNGGWYNPSQDHAATVEGSGQGYDTGIWITYGTNSRSAYGFGDWTYPGTVNQSVTTMYAYMQWVK